MDVRIPRIRVRATAAGGGDGGGEGGGRLEGKRLLVEVGGWEADSRFPHGRVVEIVGDVADLETEVSFFLV